jgi:transcriptional regulator with XRE-family HTH domain
MPEHNKRADLPGLGDRLRSAREAAGLSQGQVAQILEMHRPSVSEIEAESRKVSAGELAQFAELYKVSLEWLIGTENQNSRVKMAARKLGDLKDKDLDTALRIIDSLWHGSSKRK